MNNKSLYERLGGYDAIAAVAENLLPRLAGEDGVRREGQLLIDFLCDRAGGPLFYTGRDMLVSHRGMNISDSDWVAFTGHLEATLDHFGLAEQERGDVLAFIESTRGDIVETA